jgi:hypothetical protein
VQSLAAPAAAESSPTTVLEFLRWLDSNEHPFWASFDHNRATYWDYSVGQIGSGGGNEERDVEEEIGLGLGPPAAAEPGFAQSTVSGSRVVAELRIASSVGDLSVPASWSTSAPAVTPRAASDGTHWAVPVDDEETEATVPAPGMVANADHARFGVGPRYGVTPVVMPRRGF